MLERDSAFSRRSPFLCEWELAAVRDARQATVPGQRDVLLYKSRGSVNDICRKSWEIESYSVSLARHYANVT